MRESAGATNRIHPLGTTDRPVSGRWENTCVKIVKEFREGTEILRQVEDLFDTWCIH